MVKPRLQVKHLAEKQGLNISQLAEKSCVSRPTMHALWHDHALRVDIDTLYKVAGALKVRVGDLFIDEGPEQSEQRAA